MPAGQGDLQGAPRLRLTSDLGEVRDPTLRRRVDRPRHAVRCTRAFHQLHPWRGGGLAARPSRPNQLNGAEQRLDAEDDDALDELGLLHGARGDDHPSDAASGQRGHHRQHAGDRPDLAAERELADQGEPAGARSDLFGAEQDADRDREIERGARLAQVRRSEVHGDPTRWVDKSGIPDGASNPFPGLLERGIGQPDDREPGQAGCDVDLDPDQPSVEAVERRGWNDRQHTAQASQRLSSAGQSRLIPHVSGATRRGSVA